MPQSVSNPNAAPAVHSSCPCKAEAHPTSFQRVAGSLAGLLCQNRSNVQVATSQLHLLTHQLLDSNGPSIEMQNELMAQFVQRSQRLGYTREKPLFIFANDRDIKARGAVKPGDTLIVKPLNDAKRVLVDLYNKKYGIRIIVETNKLTPEQMARTIERECAKSKGKPIGMILQTMDPLTVYENIHGGSDYAGHVTPALMQKNAKGFDIVSLDSAMNTNMSLILAGLKLQKNNAPIRAIRLQKGRQADWHSCHTDALQILKDSLLRHGNSVNSIVDELESQFRANTESTDDSRFGVTIDLPPYLQKSTQRSSAMVSHNFTIDQLMQTQLPATQANKSQTVQQHRERYSRTRSNEQSTTRNHFLAVKAFHNAHKVLTHLESFDNERTRQDYLAGLRKNYT